MTPRPFIASAFAFAFALIFWTTGVIGATSRRTLDTPPSSASTFGIRQDADAITVDTGAGLVFIVSRQSHESRGRRAGDITSMTYGRVQYQDRDKGSHVNSGFTDLYDGQSGVDVSAQMVDGDSAKVTVRAGRLTHYYMARRGVSAIFMATVFTTEPKPNFVRFIARIPRAVLPDGPVAADVSGADHLVEAHDIFGLPNGETRSKHYSNMRLKDWRFFGARGPGAGIWMVRDDNEGGSGGPFYRSLLVQGAPADQELTYIVNYGEGQTEPYRMGHPNTYALVFTPGAAPEPVDTSWLGRMGLEGDVPLSARGRVAGDGLSGMNAVDRYTVGFANSAAQYWTDAAPIDGRFERAGMLPGAYRMTVYKNELEVAARDVTVGAGATTPVSSVQIDADPDQAAAVWRIGQWDGSPTEFLNGEKMTWMHPSDVRMALWQTAPFVVGHSTPAHDFPACLWADVNAPLRIRFMLLPSQVAAMTLRIGITVAFANARPVVTVNGWKSPAPAPSVQPTSRSLTVGSYRGNNRTFSFLVPATAFKAGDNELRVSLVSGSGKSGFLSAGVAFDAIDLVVAGQR